MQLMIRGDEKCSSNQVICYINYRSPLKVLVLINLSEKDMFKDKQTCYFRTEHLQ